MRLAFIDHHLANYHADTFCQLLGSTFEDWGVELIGYETDPTPGTDWCAERGVRRAASLDEALAWADGVIILAPDNLTSHRDFAAHVLPAGKPTVFDKLLDLDPDAAAGIVTLAADHGTPIFSGSALRYAAEVEELLDGVDPSSIQDAFARGYGQWDHYGIHTLSLGVRLGGFDITRLRESGTADSRSLTLDHGGRRTLIDCRTGTNADQVLGWTCGIKVDDLWRTATITRFDEFYANLLENYLDFLAGGEPESSATDLARLVAVLAGSDLSLAAGGDWIDLP